MPGAGVIVVFLYVQVLAATVLLREAGILLVAGIGSFGGLRITAKDWRALPVWISSALLAVAVGCDYSLSWLAERDAWRSRINCACLVFSSVLGLTLHEHISVGLNFAFADVLSVGGPIPDLHECEAQRYCEEKGSEVRNVGN
jgi:hypothetical protein